LKSETQAIPIHFSSKTADFAWLSNFSPDPFTIEGVRWPSVEHFYQAQKYESSEIAERIRLAETPLKARKAGQDRSLAPRADWQSIKEDIMRIAVMNKFAQNRRIREQLLATGDEELFHISNSDSYWGRSSDGEGDNRLGQILMDVRTTLRKKR
jgi:N-glycosidase YbiA